MIFLLLDAIFHINNNNEKVYLYTYYVVYFTCSGITHKKGYYSKNKIVYRKKTVKSFTIILGLDL